MQPPRYLADVPLPPYTHVPGRTPHPVSDPHGHSFGHAPPRPAAPDPDDWRGCADYLRGLDLFNRGFYWEAHEAWEALWHVCGRRGRTADFLKGLIKLAAAGVKVREGRPRGVVGHARAAADLFRRVGPPNECCLGLSPGELIRFAEAVADHPPACRDPAAPVEVVFAMTLRPEPP
jgi:uncharacterized protein